MLVKPCTKCGVMKSSAMYHKNRNGSYMGACKQCHAKHANKYYHEKVRPLKDERKREESNVAQSGDVGAVS